MKNLKTLLLLVAAALIFVLYKIAGWGIEASKSVWTFLVTYKIEVTITAAIILIPLVLFFVFSAAYKEAEATEDTPSDFV